MSKKGLTILFVLFFSFCNSYFVFGQSSLEQELEAKRRAKEQLEEELRKDQAKLDEVSAQKNTLNKAVTELDLTGKKLGTEVRLTESKINETDYKIKTLNLTIEQKEERIDMFKQSISSSIRFINENESKSFIFNLLSKNNITEVINETHNRISLNKDIKNAIDVLDTEKRSLEIDKNEREKKKEELEDYKGEVLTQKKEVDVNKKEKDALLAETKKQEANYQKMIEEKRRLQAEFEEELEALEAKIKFDLDPNSYPKAKNGILAWPVERVLITQAFGLTESSKRLYSYRTGAWSGKHAGVDFRANNDKVLAMADGVVEGLGNTDQVCPKASTGVWLLIKYDNGLASTFFHLSSVVVKKGDRVKTGDLVAYSGNTGYSTAPHLHIGVMPASAVSVTTWASKGCPGKNYTTPVVANSTYFDPMLYLPKADKSMFKEGIVN